MLGQAAAVLVTLAALIAANLGPVALLAVLGKRLTIAGSPRVGCLQFECLVGRRVITVIDGALLRFLLEFRNSSVRGQAGRRRWQAANRGCSGEGILGHGVSSTAVDNGDGTCLIAVVHGGREGSDIGNGRRDRLAAGYTVVCVEGGGEEGV